MSSISTSPLFTSGARYQYVAVSVSQLSFTTTQSSCRSARRVAPPLSEVAGFCPTQHIALTLPSAMAEGKVKAMCCVGQNRSEAHTSELQSPYDLVSRLLLEKK